MPCLGRLAVFSCAWLTVCLASPSQAGGVGDDRLTPIVRDAIPDDP